MTQEIKITFSGQDQGASATAEKVAASMGRVNKVAGDQTKIMSQLAPQFTDVFVSLAGGQNPMMVMIQQGGQINDLLVMQGKSLKDLGSIIPQALGSFARFLGPVGSAALAAAAGLAVLYKGMQQSIEFRDTMAMTGGAAGITEGGFNQLAKTAAEAAGSTVGAAREIAMGLVASGRIGAPALETMTIAAARVAEVSGRTADDVVKDFAGMANGVASWAVEHNKSWHFATNAQIDYIKGLEDAGLKQQAMAETGKLLIDHLKEQAQNLGYLERAWKGVKEIVSGTTHAMFAFGRPKGPEDQRQAITDRLNEWAAANPVYKTTPAAQKEIAGLEAQLENLNRLSLRGAEKAMGKSSAALQQEQERADREEFKRLSAMVAKNTEYTKVLEDVAKLKSRGFFKSDAEYVDFMGSVAGKFGQDPKAAADAAAAEAQKREREYLASREAILKNRAPRLAEIEAKGYEAANRAAEENMAKTAHAQSEAMKRAEDMQARYQQSASDAAMSLMDENRAIEISMIQDARKRGEAQIQADYETSQQRLAIMRAFGAETEAAEQELDRNRVLRMKDLADKLKPEWQRMVEGWADANKTMTEAWDSGVADMLQSSSDAFGQWAAGMNVSVDNLLRGFAAKMASAMFNNMMASMLANILPGVFGGGGGAGTITGGGGLKVPTMSAHTGAIIGTGEGGMRSVNPALFNSAPRFHTGGLVGGEVPAVLLKGEGVFTPGQMRALGAGLNRAQKPSAVLNQPVNITIDARSDQAQVAAQVEAGMRQARKQTLADLKSLGLLPA
jgi:phage-related minor tail protein